MIISIQSRPLTGRKAGIIAAYWVGDPKQRVDTLAVALDMTPEAVQMAREAGAQLFISHHPVIFHAQKQFFGARARLFACTGRDERSLCAYQPGCGAGGVNDVLAEKLGLSAVEAVPPKKERPCCGLAA